jgi:endonuclease III
VNLIGNLLEKDNFLRQNSSSVFIKSNADINIQIDLSQSFQSPSIICCCSSTIVSSLRQLVSYHNTKSNSIINLIISAQSTDAIDWNSLTNLITTYNLSLNIAKDENDLTKKLGDIIRSLVKQNSLKRSNSSSNQQSPTIETQVIY